MLTTDDEHVTGSRVIIDDVLIHSTAISLLLLLLECYMRVYFKYRESFKLAKCDFLSERFEFVGRDIMPTGNTTAASKYDLINDWKLPVTAAGLHSFVSHINVYNKFSPLFRSESDTPADTVHPMAPYDYSSFRMDTSITSILRGS